MMNMNRIAILGALIGITVGLSACGLAPVEPGEPVALGPNDGIAAVVIDSLDLLSQISFEPVGHDAKTLAITDAPKGVTLYMFVVPAGTYCVAGFHFGSWSFHSVDPKHGTCFDVLAGKIAYSGNVAPRAVNGGSVRTYQNYDWPAFEAKLKKEYPDIAAKYPLVTP